jgi:hypothetical protein
VKIYREKLYNPDVDAETKEKFKIDEKERIKQWYMRI